MDSHQQPQASQVTNRSAPILEIPGARVVTLEHPSIVQNFDNGFKSLGGEPQLKHVLEHHVGDSKLHGKQNHLPEPVAGVSLRPNDPLTKKISSTGIESRNVLVKVTLPRRTGRKRKRGSEEPFAEPAQPETPNVSIKAPELLQRLRDNESRYEITPVALVKETHRFRGLPDFQIRNSELPIMRELRDHAMIPEYERLKHFSVDPSPALPVPTMFPGPPSFTSIDMPHKWEYQQAASVIYVPDGQGSITTKNLAKPPKRITWGLPPDIDEVPQGPPRAIPTRNPNGDMLPRAIEELQKLLDERPLVTKRVALNALPPISESIFKEATQFVGYSFKAGPWRDSLIKYGVDPRKDPKYRFYQTVMFQIDNVAFKTPQSKGNSGMPSVKTSSTWARPLRHQRAEPTTHIFDGKSITANGKTWQLCDVTEPLVHEIFHTSNIRSECDVYQWGWYYNGTMAKGRGIMKDMMRFLFQGEELPEQDYRIIAQFPDELTAANMHETVLSAKDHGPRLAQLALEVRNLIKAGENPRMNRAGYWGPKSGKTDSQGKPVSSIDGAGVGGIVAEKNPGEDAQVEHDEQESEESDDGGEGDFERDDDAVDPQLRATDLQEEVGRQDEDDHGEGEDEDDEAEEDGEGD